MQSNIHLAQNSTCLDVDEKVLVALGLGHAEEVEALVEDGEELGVLADGGLGGDLREVGPVHDQLLGRGHVGGDEEGVLALLLAQQLLEVLGHGQIYFYINSNIN